MEVGPSGSARACRVSAAAQYHPLGTLVVATRPAIAMPTHHRVRRGSLEARSRGASGPAHAGLETVSCVIRDTSRVEYRPEKPSSSAHVPRDGNPAGGFDRLDTRLKPRDAI